MYSLLLLIVPFPPPTVEYGIDDHGCWIEVSCGNYGIDIWDNPRGDQGIKIQFVGPNNPREG